MTGVIFNNCEVCGVKFASNTRSAKYCNKCRNDIRRDKSRDAYQSAIGFSETRICDKCKTEYIARNKKQRYCSAKCRTEDAKKDYFSILERDFFKCIYCGKSSIEDGIKLQLDHIIPVSRGGLDIAGNLITACADCNVLKSNSTIDVDIVEKIINVVTGRNRDAGMSNSKVITLPGSKNRRGYKQMAEQQQQDKRA